MGRRRARGAAGRILAMAAVTAAVAGAIELLEQEDVSVERILHDSRFVEVTGPRSLRYQHSAPDMLGALTSYSYDVTIHPHVTTLNDNPHVLKVVCPDAHTMTIFLSDSRAAEAWVAGQILAGTQQSFECQEAADGPAMPFARILKRLSSFTIGVGNNEASYAHSADVPWEDLRPNMLGRIVFETSLAGPEHCFESVSMEYSRVPAPHEAELRRALAGNATMQDELRRRYLQSLWDRASNLFSNAASNVASGVSSAVNAVSNTVSTAASTVVRTYNAAQSVVSSVVQTGECDDRLLAQASVAVLCSIPV